MIDTKEMRRLAQEATPGPWYVTGNRTRYVEARIDGGLIQEVAACGPTKADGGYGPQQEANARLIAAANPAAVSEIIDRLEAAESEAIEQARLNGMGSEREAALMAKLEAAEKSDAESIAMYRKARDERDALRAKIAEMEKQAPVGEIRAANELGIAPYADIWPCLKAGDKLYALPGAQAQGEEK